MCLSISNIFRFRSTMVIHRMQNYRNVRSRKRRHLCMKYVIIKLTLVSHNIFSRHHFVFLLRNRYLLEAQNQHTQQLHPD